MSELRLVQGVATWAFVKVGARFRALGFRVLGFRVLGFRGLGV